MTHGQALENEAGAQRAVHWIIGSLRYPNTHAILMSLPEEKKAPRPDLTGRRLKRPDHPAVYMVDMGYKRLIPDPVTYNNLFVDWTSVATDIELDELPDGPFLSAGAMLVRAAGSEQVFMVDRGTKRPIAGEAAMTLHGFNARKILDLPKIVVDAIPAGRGLGA
jgi:hypothetical protein